MLSRNFKIFMKQNSLVHYFQKTNLKQGTQNNMVKKTGRVWQVFYWSAFEKYSVKDD